MLPKIQIKVKMKCPYKPQVGFDAAYNKVMQRTLQVGGGI